MAQVAVTGAAGNLAGRVVPHLLEHGWDVVTHPRSHARGTHVPPMLVHAPGATTPPISVPTACALSGWPSARSISPGQCQREGVPACCWSARVTMIRS